MVKQANLQKAQNYFGQLRLDRDKVELNQNLKQVEKQKKNRIEISRMNEKWAENQNLLHLKTNKYKLSEVT